MLEGLLLFAAFAGCGSRTSSDATAPSPADESNNFSGTVGGVSADAVDSFFSVVTGPAGAALAVEIGNIPNLCALAAIGTKPNAFTVTLEVGDFTAGVAPVGPGTYPIDHRPAPPGLGHGTSALAKFIGTNASCVETDVYATGGSITLSAVSDAYVVGSFQLTFANGDQLSGAFTAPHCDPPTTNGPRPRVAAEKG